MTRNDGFRSLQADDLQNLDQMLAAFIAETKARCALLMDRTGRFLTAAGDTESVDGVTFASLAAADFSASDQLAMILGEEEFTSLYHQGESRSMYLAGVGDQAILAALFDERTTLGLVRMKIRVVAPRFEALFAEIAARDPRSGPGLEPNWADEASDTLDRLFAD